MPFSTVCILHKKPNGKRHIAQTKFTICIASVIYSIHCKDASGRSHYRLHGPKLFSKPLRSSLEHASIAVNVKSETKKFQMSAHSFGNWWREKERQASSARSWIALPWKLLNKTKVDIRREYLIHKSCSLFRMCCIVLLIFLIILCFILICLEIYIQWVNWVKSIQVQSGWNF